MVNLLETEAYIRFQLSQIGANNQHHGFEDICFRIAQRRISSNILPATGPVSSGGDQGRDGETFFSALPEELPQASGFVGRSTTKPLVVACTIQQEGLSSKVKADLLKITSQGQPVERVAYFLAEDMPVGARHKLQKHARETLGLDLEIFDAKAISTMLAQADLVWVAETMLNLPAFLVPTDDRVLPGWYQELLQRVRNSPSPLYSAGDLAAVRTGLRHATHNSEAQPDLVEWIEHGRTFIRGAPGNLAPEEVRMKARYELIVASLRGMNTLHGVEKFIDDFIEYSIQSSLPSLILDASNLLSYWKGAWAAGLAATTPQHLVSQLARLLERTNELIANMDRTIYPNAVAHLLSVKAHILFHPDITGFERDEEAPIKREQRTPEELEASFDEILSTAGTAEKIFIPVDPLMSTLVELAGLLPETRTFPIQSICDLFEMFAPVLSGHDQYELIRNALDLATGKVEGDNAVAERCRKRAIKLWEADKPLLALREFHGAKINWFHGETLRGSILAMLTIAEVYAQLKLPHAAKKYALTAASVAVSAPARDVADLVPAGLLQAFRNSYQAGSWVDATALGQLAIRAHNTYAANPFDREEHPELVGLDFYQSMICMAAKRFKPDLVEVLTAIMTPTGYDEMVWEMVGQTQHEFQYGEENFAALSCRELGGRPFSDTGQVRSLNFAALGTRWHVSCSNERASVLAAERFAAAVQILLCELASDDPVLLEENVYVHVDLAGSSETERVKFEPDNEKVLARVLLTPYETTSDAGELGKEILEVVGVLLFHVSALPQEQLLNMLERAFKRGLLNHLSFGRPFDEVAGLLDEEHYDKVSAVPFSGLGSASYDLKPASALEQPATYGPGFTEDQSRQMISERYELSSTISFTMARILKNDTCRRTLKKLRDEKWHDWHLLLAIFNAATNYRISQHLGDLSSATPQRLQQVSRKLAGQVESPQHANIPLHNFSEENLRNALQMATLSIAQRLGLHPNRKTPNFHGIRQLLIRRYGFMDDVEHRDLLEPLA